MAEAISPSLLEELEGRKPKAYKDTANLWTIGIGHKLTADELKSGQIQIGQEWVPWRPGLSDAHIDALHAQDLAVARGLVDKYVKVSLGPNQRQAMESFFYQTGRQALKGATLRALNAGNFQEFLRRHELYWNKNNGRIIPGLVNRRAKEREWFNRDPHDPHGQLLMASRSPKE